MNARLYPGITLERFALLIAEDLRVATASSRDRANEIATEVAALRSPFHPNYGTLGHERAVATGVRELNEEAHVLGREITRLRQLVDLLIPYVSQLADAER